MSIKLIKTLQRQKGVTQDAHIANVLYVSNNRKRSCTELSLREQKQLINIYRNMKSVMPPQLKMIYSLWGQLHRAGLVNVDSKQACDTFCEKHLQGKKLAGAANQWGAIIEVLKAWLKRGEVADAS
ncbi:MAG: phage protein GemA/Gp16 family protein [Pseudomonadota bacterium]|nr:phage protein GemA/Gp16 family protein [Pseudomonadota bacterium]